MQQSNMHKRNLAICIVCNQSYIFALSTLIVNLKKSQCHMIKSSYTAVR